MPLYVVFIDFSKAFDTVSRQGLWQVLKKYGCAEKCVSLIEALHTGMQANVTMSGSVSKDLEQRGETRCVLAPTLFSLYLAAMLDVAFKDTSEGIYIRTRKDSDLFNVAQFKAKSKTSVKVVREMLLADDIALVAHSAEYMQSLVEKFARAASQFCLKINIKKKECLYQPSKFKLSTSLPEEISIGTEPLVKCKSFKYLGSTVSENARLEGELSLRMGRVSAVFGNLRERLWNNLHVSIRVKCKVYRATVLATLLYGAETWTVHRVQVEKLHVHILRAIMNISWKDKITNIKMLKRAGLPSMEDMLIQTNLRWHGNVERMDHQRLPRQLMKSTHSCVRANAIGVDQGSDLKTL